MNQQTYNRLFAIGSAITGTLLFAYAMACAWQQFTAPFATVGALFFLLTAGHYWARATTYRVPHESHKTRPAKAQGEGRIQSGRGTAHGSSRANGGD